MSQTLLPMMGKRHPLTGEPIQAVGFRCDGRPIWPIMGGDGTNDPPERPEDVSEEEWDALGDPGKRAIVRERERNADLERQLAAAKARPAPPKKPEDGKTDPPKPDDKNKGGKDDDDVDARIAQAVQAAVKPLVDREAAREAQDAAGRIKDAVTAAAKDKFLDSSDALQINLAAVVAEDGTPDAEKITTALDELLKQKPHLARDARRVAMPGVGPTLGGAEVPLQQRTQQVLAEMQAATGIRPPKQ